MLFAITSRRESEQLAPLSLSSSKICLQAPQKRYVVKTCLFNEYKKRHIKMAVCGELAGVTFFAKPDRLFARLG